MGSGLPNLTEQVRMSYSAVISEQPLLSLPRILDVCTLAGENNNDVLCLFLEGTCVKSCAPLPFNEPIRAGATNLRASLLQDFAGSTAEIFMVLFCAHEHAKRKYVGLKP
jgi:hypothetical protein